MEEIFMVQFLGRTFFMLETSEDIHNLSSIEKDLKITKIEKFTISELKDLYLDPNVNN